MKIVSFCAGLLLVLTLVITSKETVPKKNEIRIHPSEEKSIRIAVIADLHIDSSSELEQLKSFLPQIVKSDPDLIALLGDYSSVNQAGKFRESIRDTLATLASRPVVAVLGNHDNLSDRDAWLTAFRRTDIKTLENQSAVIATHAGIICVRGLGDYYSGQLRSTPWLGECGGLPRVTITHDPAGALELREPGFYLAGHTHCGQVKLPIFGALFIPSDAPGEASCGLYETDGFTLWVSSGIGTSIINFRLGTNSEWDLLEIPLSRLIDRQ